MSTIPLTSGLAYQTFTVTQGNAKLRFYLHWLTRYRYYSVDVYDSADMPVACGRALHPGMDLVAGLNVDIGTLILEGEQPTLNNLGLTNRLIWTAP